MRHLFIEFNVLTINFAAQQQGTSSHDPTIRRIHIRASVQLKGNSWGIWADPRDLKSSMILQSDIERDLKKWICHFASR